MQLEVAAAHGQHAAACERGRPDDFAVHDPLDVLDNRITLIACLPERGLCVGAEQHGVGAVDAGKPQLFERVADRIGILADVGR